MAAPVGSGTTPAVAGAPTPGGGFGVFVLVMVVGCGLTYLMSPSTPARTQSQSPAPQRAPYPAGCEVWLSETNWGEGLENVRSVSGFIHTKQKLQRFLEGETRSRITLVGTPVHKELRPGVWGWYYTHKWSSNGGHGTGWLFWPDDFPDDAEGESLMFKDANPEHAEYWGKTGKVTMTRDRTK